MRAHLLKSTGTALSTRSLEPYWHKHGLLYAVFTRKLTLFAPVKQSSSSSSSTVTASLLSVNKKPTSNSTLTTNNPTTTPSSPSTSTTTSATKSNESEVAVKSTVSKAMHSYLERAKEHQRFIKEQEQEFSFGRRHLANMMGKDPETFTQNDISEAIRYLFPAGLFDPKARPMMKPPAEIFPQQKAAQFDLNGRPYHPFYYTAKPNYYFLIHEIVGKLEGLNSPSVASQTKLINEASDFAGSTWITKEDLEKRLVEYVSDDLYKEFINLLERLVTHPRGGKELEFIKTLRRTLVSSVKSQELPQVTLEPDGKQSVTVEYCQKKTALGTVTVRMPGTGLFNINGKGLDYFDTIQPREMLLFPLQLTDWLGTVDIISTITSTCDKADKEAALRPDGNRKSAEAYAIRWGISMGLAALGADFEKLRLAGLLTRDRRRKERKHMGCVGARAKWTWKKR